MIHHYGLSDQISVSGHSDTQLIEYVDFLRHAVQHPVEVREGCYLTPTAPGWGLEFLPDFIEQYRFPEGDVWKTRSPLQKGVSYEFAPRKRGK